MHTVIKGALVLAESWETQEEGAWVPFHDLVVEAGTPRSFARFPSEESATPVAQRFGGRTGEVLVLLGGKKFEIVLSKPFPGPVGQPKRGTVLSFAQKPEASAPAPGVPTASGQSGGSCGSPPP